MEERVEAAARLVEVEIFLLEWYRRAAHDRVRPAPVLRACQGHDGAARVAVAIRSGAHNDSELAALGVVVASAAEHHQCRAVGQDHSCWVAADVVLLKALLIRRPWHSCHAN